jgi:hypothetical protein
MLSQQYHELLAHKITLHMYVRLHPVHLRRTWRLRAEPRGGREPPPLENECAEDDVVEQRSLVRGRVHRKGAGWMWTAVCTRSERSPDKHCE